jgi:4-amino-4-deoxy-L-arabinose transferase-like glycosyltransferase
VKGANLAILLILAGLLYFLGLGSLGLTDRDEGSNAEAAREMVESGDWITPTLNGEPRFAKPVFIYWLMSGAYRIVGMSESSARLPSAIFGILLILLHYLFLARVRGSQIAMFGALMLLVNVEMIAIGRLALTDSVLIFFTTLAIYGFWLGLHASDARHPDTAAEPSVGPEDSSRHFIWLFYVGMAIGTLTKGPIGIAIPLLAAIPYLTITRRWGQFWRQGRPMAGLVLFLALAVPWYAVMLSIHGGRYTASAQADTVGRFFNVIGGHGGTILFYIPVVFFGFFPWSGFLPAALAQAFKGWREARGTLVQGRRPPSPGELELFAACWLICTFIFFSLSATRLPHYIGPLFPAASILTAIYWNRCLVDLKTPGVRASFRTMMALGYVLGIALAATPWLYQRFVDKIAKEFPIAHQVDPGIGPVIAGLILLIGMAAVGYFGLSDKRRPGAIWAAGAVLVFVMFVGIQLTLPRFNRFFIAPPQELAYTAGVNLTPEDRLILYGPPKPSFIFYARRKVIMIKPGEELQMVPHLSLPGRTMILLPSRLRDKLPSETAKYPVILERYGYLLLANKPIFDVPELPPEMKAKQFLSPHGL